MSDLLPSEAPAFVGGAGFGDGDGVGQQHQGTELRLARS